MNPKPPTPKLIQILAAGAVLAALLILPFGTGDVSADDCFLKQTSGVMCDTECSGSIGCFDQSNDTCCWDSLNACGMEESCEVCKGPGCELGDF